MVLNNYKLTFLLTVLWSFSTEIGYLRRGESSAFLRKFPIFWQNNSWKSFAKGRNLLPLSRRVQLSWYEIHFLRKRRLRRSQNQFILFTSKYMFYLRSSLHIAVPETLAMYHMCSLLEYNLLLFCCLSLSFPLIFFCFFECYL